MAQDLATITANLQATYPTLTQVVNGTVSTLNQTDYAARIADMANAELARQLADDESVAEKTLRDQVRTALARLNQIESVTPGTVTNTQRDQAIIDIATYLDKLIRVLIDRKLIEAS
jgi:hypothetical protein